MAACVYCGSETSLFISGRAVCLDCSNDLDAGRKPPSREQKIEGEAGGEKSGTDD